MKYLLFLLITFQANAHLLEVDFKSLRDTTVTDTIPDSTIIDYHLDIAGKSKFRDSVIVEKYSEFKDSARFTSLVANYIRVTNLRMPISDGVLRMANGSVVSSKVFRSDIEIDYKKIMFGGPDAQAKVSESFVYNDSTGTLYVPNIVVGEGASEELFFGKKIRKVKEDYKLEDRIETVLVDTTDKDVAVELFQPEKEGKILTLKKTKGKHRILIKGKIADKGNDLQDLKVKNFDTIKLIWDGAEWQKL